MIKQIDVVKIGFFTKPHGVFGDLRLEFEGRVFEVISSDYLICDMEGILVPFFVESYRLGGGKIAYVKLERIDDLTQTNRFMGVSVYLPSSHVDEEFEENTYDPVIGFYIHDKVLGNLGFIQEVDETTSNVLFVVIYNHREILIPVHEDLILGVDQSQKTIYVDLPEGLVDLESLE